MAKKTKTKEEAKMPDMPISGIVKRFATYEESFAYFLVKSQYRIYKKGIMSAFKMPAKLRWIDEMCGSEAKDAMPSWSTMDAHIRQIAAKTSNLSRAKRDLVLEILATVEHFVAKDGEEITMTRADIEEAIKKQKDEATQMIASKKQNKGIQQ